MTDPFSATLIPALTTTLARLSGGSWCGSLVDVPVQPDRRQARTWAQEELARREYQAERPGPVRLLLTWLREQLSRVPAPEGVEGRLGLTVAVALGLALIGYVVWRSGGVHRRSRAHPGQVFEAGERTADEYRRAAESAEAAGDLRTALLERFRAIARVLADRAVVELSPGLTADELARRAGGRLPGLAADLASAARVFDDVRYGDHPPTPAAVRALRDLDERAMVTTPVPAGQAGAGAPAVPR